MENLSNNASTFLSSNILPTDTTIFVNSSVGFPEPLFRVTIDSEICICTAVSGTTWTVTRAQEGTTATGHSQGATVANVLTVAGLVTIIDQTTGDGGDDNVPQSRNINTTSPLSGGGSLASDLTLSIAPATDSAAGSMSGADKTKLDALSTIVSSFNGRSNAVTPQAGDYSASQITGLSSASITVGGDLSGTTAGATVATVGGSTAANIHTAEQAANAATSADTVSTIVARDSSGNFSAGIVTAALSGNATTATTAANLSGNITTSQVTGLGSAASHSTGTFCQTANNLSDVTAATALANLLPSPVAVNATTGEITATHFLGSGTPTAAVGAAAGAGSSVVVATGGTDNSFQVVYTNGGTTTSGTICTITFAKAFATAPICQISPGSNNSTQYWGTSHLVYVTSTTTTMSINMGTGTITASGTVITFNVHT